MARTVWRSLRMQSKRQSFFESVVNVLSGFLLSLCLWLFIITPYFDIKTNINESLGVTLIFTVVSVARSYFWRRVFNKIVKKYD